MLSEHVIQFAALFQNPLALSLVLFALVTTLVGLGVPGVIVPLSLSSGALLGGWMGMLVVILGTLLGSQTLFLYTRRFLRDWFRQKAGSRLETFEREVDARGFCYLVGLRLVGAPHVLVTAGSALTPIDARLFAAATLVGFFPIVAITAVAGATL